MRSYFCGQQFFFKITSIVIVINVCLVIGQDEEKDWCYEGNKCGPRTWEGLCNTGRTQSPINIVPSTTTRTKPDRTLVFSAEWFEVKDFDILNKGHTIAIGPHFETDGSGDDAGELRVKGAGWNGTYSFVEMQFHWGSEHTIKGQRYPLELQILMSNANEDLGMLCIMFGLTKAPSKILAPIVALLPQVTDFSVSSTKIPNGLTLGAFLPTVWDIFRYSGSLTIPPCNQSVMWSVFTQKMPVSQAQLNEFAKIKDEKGNIIKANYRPLQTVITKERKRVYWMPINKAKMRENIF